ncbi:hypothetical protein ONJ16_27960, partial [Salmonella enterica subsp. enterica serovar Montevideo]|nr:hypothetical protein [Salmonella enterica subsp. enterica serovar Montevideo]
NALFGCRMLSSFISVVSAFIGDRLQRRHRGDRGLARKRLENQYQQLVSRRSELQKNFNALMKKKEKITMVLSDAYYQS